MNFKGKDLSVLGGFLFATNFVFDRFINLTNILSEYFLPDFFNIMTQILGILSSISYFVFVVLILICLFKKNRFNFLQNFINKFPKISVYLYYIGFIGYILLLLDVVILPFIMTDYLSELPRQYLAVSLGVVNIIGDISSLIIATSKVFFQAKKSKD